jgi:hypothetical protein
MLVKEMSTLTAACCNQQASTLPNSLLELRGDWGDGKHGMPRMADGSNATSWVGSVGISAVEEQSPTSVMEEPFEVPMMPHWLAVLLKETKVRSPCSQQLGISVQADDILNLNEAPP